MSTFSVQGWIDDFVAFSERARVVERGFTEKIVRLDGGWRIASIVNDLPTPEHPLPARLAE